MLQTQALEKSTFLLLKELCQNSKLSSFILGGGTALALRLGHRISIDLVFFTTEDFDTKILVDELMEKYDIHNISLEKNSLSCLINYRSTDIKVDFLKHGYKLLNTTVELDNIRLFSIDDMAAMKLNAIGNRGAKKDFFDIYSLLEKYTIMDMLNLFEKKYPLVNSLSVIKSLSYFKDANRDPDPISLININWSDVKEKIKGTINL